MSSNYIAGTLELTSKVRYGITSRGVPIFRFIAYDKAYGIYAVSCSQRELSQNVHVIIEPSSNPTKPGEIPRGNLIKNLGTINDNTEVEILLATYAYNSSRQLLKHPKDAHLLEENFSKRPPVQGFTFNIDPPGCKDVDDTVSICVKGDGWRISINIADVASIIEEGSALDLSCLRKATSFYSPEGFCLAPMLPEYAEQRASLLPGCEKATFSLQFDLAPDGTKTNFKFLETRSTTHHSFTYDDANDLADEYKYPLTQIAKGSQDPHKWIECLMILYNEKAGEALKKKGLGILRKHKETYSNLDPEYKFLGYESAKFCQATDEDTRHFGLDSVCYAYASSPIRRYADLVNQRALKGPKSPISDSLIEHLNKRQKHSKAFGRDLFFARCLFGCDKQEGIVILVDEKTHIYIPTWKRVIKVELCEKKKGESVYVDWYCNKKEANWKNRIVFRIS